MDYLSPIDHTAPGFEDLYDELPLWSAPFGLMVLDRAPLGPDLTILDVGAGTGFLSIELAERCGPGATVIAVDPWAGAMARLRRKIEQRSLKNVHVLEQDAARLDLADASVDLIISNLGINNFEDPEAVLRECRRVAKPGASLVLTTNPSGHMAELYEELRAVLVELGREDRLAALDAHVAHRSTVESLTVLLAGAGFSVRDAFTSGFRMRFASGTALLRHFFIRLGFLPGWKAVMPAGAVAEGFRMLERRLDAAAARRGELALTIPMVCLSATRDL